MFRRPEPTSVAAQVAQRLGLTRHATASSPRGDADKGWATMMDRLSDLSGDDQADYSMAAPGALIEQSVERLNALGADFEPEALAAALLPSLVALGRCHHAGGDDDDEAAAQSDESTPARRRAKYATRERHVDDVEQAELQRRCIPEGMSGHVVSHIRR